MRGYSTHDNPGHVPGVAALTIRSLLDRQQYADAAGTAAGLGIGSGNWSLFGLLWPSGVQLAARLAERPVRPGERILEIGCGLGLASLVAHRRGADVTASDSHPLAGPFLADNLRLNGLEPMKYRHGHWGADARQSRHALASGLHTLRGRFDHIVGSDLLYERDERGVLARFIGRHAAPGALVWIVDPDRGNRSAFNRNMAGLGFTLHEERLDRAATEHALAYKGRLMSYRRTPIAA
ncbi:MAG: class I SAM-dependent methyltransferase [Rubrivivax sp.]|jgi:predicted nicotinamide N-methyase|nr:methyltransferase domain-containing protein [Rubrivivax sp.]